MDRCFAGATAPGPFNNGVSGGHPLIYIPFQGRKGIKRMVQEIIKGLRS